MLKTLAQAGAMALVLMLAPVAAMAAVVDMPPAAVVVADPAVISLAPLADYLYGIAAILVPAILTWFGVTVLKMNRKSAAIDELNRMAEKAFEAGEPALREFAKHLTVTVNHPTVRAIAGYIVHQAPDFMRQAGMTEAQVAAWITRLAAGKAVPE